MSEEARATPVNPPEQETSAPAEPTLAPPSFDARSIRGARPAVPLTRAAGRASMLKWAVVALCAGMVGGLLGIFALNSYQDKNVDQDQNAERQAAEPAPAAVSESAPGAAATPAEVRDEGVGPSPGDAARAAGARTPEAAGEDPGVAEQSGEAAAASPANGEDSAQLRGALAGWLAATNARDLERQMDFYDSRVGVFYLSRNASRDAVRAEKSHVFARASAVDVRADEPHISVSPDGRTATMRFRKQYAIEGEGLERRGAVLQELRWRRTPAGWKITGERDLRVVN